MRSTMNTFRTPAHKRRLTSLGAAVLIGASALLLTGCLEKDTTKQGSPSSTGSVETGQPGDTGRDLQATVRTVGKTGWYENFDITVDKATITPGETGGGQLLINLTYKNTSPENSTLSNNTYLQFGTEIDTAASFDNPTVPGKGSARGTITTPLRSTKDADRLLDQMTVIFGEAEDNQTKIPLSATGTLESVQPKALNITGTLVQDQTTIEITGGKLTPSYTKGERGKAELALRVKIVGGPEISDGGLNVFHDYFSVQTPGGQSLVADDRSPINELLGRGETIDNAQNYAVFVVPAPANGPYTLTYNGQKGEDAAPAATLSFTVS